MKNPFKNTRFEKACLSQIEFDDGDIEKINSWLKRRKDILYVYSGPGRGKTHFCAALTNMKFDNKEYCYYLEEREFFDILRNCIADGKSYIEKIKMICENDFLILDDLGSTRGDDATQWLTPWQKEVLFAFLDERVKNRLPTVITSNFSPSDLLPIFHERFISRLKSSDNTLIRLCGDDHRSYAQEQVSSSLND